ncbi:VanZ family protein [Alkaliphilus peptidifermentans]|uniref:VanZ like family protein n=1 Tax=Alkaliphilus peptidifermentans DSM 18978 TaxID=1120976 RepID=A0A1G5AFD4_9FIRM|nr:VanZ family protein [Alkaliphilus peptidifermentans]SCX76575.1 VanZ like family protein [Alkaliphilus peptidifermentans DSM 18978]
MTISKKSILVLSWTTVILWMGLIFHLSAQPAAQSRELSKGVVDTVVETVERVSPNRAERLDISRLHFLIRKNAHFFAYLILGMLTINAVGKSGIKGAKGFALALLICVLYAISDEIHQIYVPGRSGELRDVLIDSSGAAIGIGIYCIAGLLMRRRKVKFDL